MVTTGTVREDIEQRNRAFEAAFNSGDMAALAAAYAEDATVLRRTVGQSVGGRRSSSSGRARGIRVSRP